MPSGVRVYGGFLGNENELSQRSFARNRTIIDGQRNGETAVRLQQGAILNGLAVINGHSNTDGGGVWMEVDAEVINAFILDNSADNYGGGIFAEGDGLVFNTLIAGNVAGTDGLAIWGTTLTVRNVTVTQNRHASDLPEVDEYFCSYKSLLAWYLLGEQSFATDSIWVVGNQIWSDAVKFSLCDKEAFDGGMPIPPVFHVDCRSNPGFKGDLFSWCAVHRFGHLLCPYPWRVPTQQDFIDLDIALGGTGMFRNDSLFVLNNYINRWGGAFGGWVGFGNAIMSQGVGGSYTSLSEQSTIAGHHLTFGLQGGIHPHFASPKSNGHPLRCLRDTVLPPPPPPLPPPAGCSANTPNWGERLGTVSFQTTTTWAIGNQVWSDAVTATACNKETFDAGASNFWTGGDFYADCRTNPGFPGHLFSWCAVARFANQLCPYPWRVPTQQDFSNLDFALGGDGGNRNATETATSTPQFVMDNYITRWGGHFGGLIQPILMGQNQLGSYWSQTHTSTYAIAFALQVHAIGHVYPLSRAVMYAGLALRCVRDTVIPPPPPVPGCSPNAPAFGNSLGVVRFETTTTWTIGNQVWSDAVTATNCNKTTFNGGDFLNQDFYADCRSNPGFPGDLFSWCAVARFADVLCPYPWRVPTIQEFRDLDIAMGGTGEFRGDAWSNQDPVFVQDNYITRWGGAFSGITMQGSMHNQGFHGDYWSQTAVNTSLMFVLNFRTDGSIYPGFQSVKDGGSALRCVRDN